MTSSETESCDLRNILLRISYDGTNFLGWQRQYEGAAGKGRTVQEEIEKVLEVMHGHPIPLIGSGRTDSGVHATGQVANFFTDIRNIPPSRFLHALNSMLPHDIRILESRETSFDFHSRFNARARMYRYQIYCGCHPFAHEMPYVWHIRRWPDIAKLNSMAAYLRGEIDCTTFAATGDKSRTRCRYLYGSHFYPDGDKLIFEITANAFLWKMVRSIIGTLLFLEEKGFPPEEFLHVIESKNRKRAGPTAPGQGLFLAHVRY